MLPIRAKASFLLCLVLATKAHGSEDADFQPCEAQFAAHPRAEESVKCFTDLSSHNSSAAVVHRLEKLLAQHPDLPWLYFYLGTSEWDTPAAEGLYRIAAGRFAELGELRGEFRARLNLYNRLFHRDHFEEATFEEQRASQLAKDSGAPDLIAHAKIFEVRALLNAGMDLGSAGKLLAEARYTIFPKGTDTLKMEWLDASGEVNLQIGQLDKAQKSFLKLKELATRTNKTYKMYVACDGLLRVLMAKAAEQPSDFDRENILEQARQSLAMALAARNANAELRTRYILGRLTGGLESRNHFARCVETSTTPADASFCRGGWARTLAENDPKQAQEILRQALDDASKQSTDSWHSIYFASDRMRVSWRTQLPSQAITDSWQALDDVEALRRVQGPASRAGLFSTFSDDYYWFSGRLLDQPNRRPSDIAQAFAVTERLRGRTLKEKLAVVRPEPPSWEVLHQRLQGVQQAIQNVAQRSADTTLPQSEVKNARQDLKQLGDERTELERQLRETGSPPAGSPPEFATLRDVQALLAPDEALLSFQVAPWKDWTGAFGGGSWLTVVTRTAATQVYKLPGREELRHGVNPLMNHLETYEESQEESRYLADLYKKLLTPAIQDLPPAIRRLVILPDDDLHKLPFAALHEAGAHPLIERYQITVAPSATLWRDWLRHPPGPAKIPALVLADPVRLGEALQRLPETAKEGRAAVNALGGESVLLTREDASEGFLKSADLSSYGIIALATHAVLEDDPERSSIRLTPSGKGTGRLEAAQILGLKMDGKVVVLSTCESAAGPILPGEGVMSLARAFFAAGAHTVVGSLWPAEDKDGESLLERFYRYLGQGDSVAAALRAAQRDQIAGGAPLKAWAGFVVLGDGDLVPLPGGRRRPPGSVRTKWAEALAALFLLGLPPALWGWRRWKGRGARA